MAGPGWAGGGLARGEAGEEGGGGRKVGCRACSGLQGGGGTEMGMA